MKKHEIVLPILEAKQSALDLWLKKISSKFCSLKKKAHLCSDFHLKQASRLAVIDAGIFYVWHFEYSSVPCGALMRPLPVSGGSQRGAELFYFLPVFNQYIVSF